MEKQIFRQKTIDRISSPEDLNKYLRTNSPGMWIVLLAIVVLLTGMLVWASVGTLQTKTSATVEAKDNELEIVVVGNRAEKVKDGMFIEVDGRQAVIENVEIDEYGRALATAVLNIPDGKYKAEIIIESIKPISFLFKNGQ